MIKRNERLDYLDGLRGWAALSVVIFHSTWELFGQALSSLRTTWPGPLNDGHFAVSIFFVLSGVVLTACATSTNDRSRLQRMAAGRYFRLTIPILAASFIGYAMMRANLLFNRDVRAILPDPWVWRTMSEQTPSIFSWLTNSLVGVYRWGGSYNPFLWTMPIELYGSFALFGAIALFGEKRAVRIGALSIGIVVAELLMPIYALFFCGALLFDLAATVRALLSKKIADFIGALLLGAAVLNSVFFRGNNETAAATAIVAGLLLSPSFQACMQTGISQWLGRLSFPLYLVHCYVLFGPACWAVMKLQALGFNLPTTAAIVSPLTVMASLGLAQAFVPVETAAIFIAHSVGSFLIAPRLPRIVIAWQTARTTRARQGAKVFLQSPATSALNAGDDLHRAGL